MQKAINAGLNHGVYCEVLRVNREFHFLIRQRFGWTRLVGLIESLWLRLGPSLNGLYPGYAQERRDVSNHMAAIEGLCI
ncbi:hypothetical protein [Bradyrhizobium diazoefficiens]|uniref:hypothetical protein n=1 Tax=Bradyrhizobium diazoefficiens TaxID=1355477 RepID=UPI001FEE1A88|nr:hypothetical protein [Bradyrhizobium diazoefficiens]